MVPGHFPIHLDPRTSPSEKISIFFEIHLKICCRKLKLECYIHTSNPYPQINSETMGTSKTNIIFIVFILLHQISDSKKKILKRLQHYQKYEEYDDEIQRKKIDNDIPCSLCKETSN